MKCNQIFKLAIALMLVLMVVVSPALAAEPRDKITVVKGGENDEDESENNEDVSDSNSTDDRVMDKILSDDQFLGFERNKDYDIFQDLSLQNAFDLASSLPIWILYVIVILLLVVSVLSMVGIVVLWNTYKGGRAATGDNPVKAAQGIKDSKMVTREYIKEVVEGASFLVCLGFGIALLM